MRSNPPLSSASIVGVAFVDDTQPQRFFGRRAARKADRPPAAAIRLLTVPEVAAMLRTSEKAVYTMVERGTLPGVARVGRRVLIRESALLDFLGHETPDIAKR